MKFSTMGSSTIGAGSNGIGKGGYVSKHLPPTTGMGAMSISGLSNTASIGGTSGFKPSYTSID